MFRLSSAFRLVTLRFDEGETFSLKKEKKERKIEIIGWLRSGLLGRRSGGASPDGAERVRLIRSACPPSIEIESIFEETN